MASTIFPPAVTNLQMLEYRKTCQANRNCRDSPLDPRDRSFPPSSGRPCRPSRNGRDKDRWGTTRRQRVVYSVHDQLFRRPSVPVRPPRGRSYIRRRRMIRQRRSRRAGSGFRIEKPIRRPHATTLPAALSKLRHDPLDKPACPPQRCASCQGSGKAVDPGAREIATSGLLRVPKKTARRRSISTITSASSRPPGEVRDKTKSFAETKAKPTAGRQPL